MAQATIEEPKGIAFYSVKTGETHYCKLEPTIAAYINSSDMGVNASRGQDFGWRLGAEWVKRVKSFRRDAMQMTLLASRNQGQKPTTVQILYHLYGEDVRAYEEEVEENENPFEEQYQQDIADKPKRAPKTAAPAAAIPSANDGEADDTANMIDDAMNDGDELDTDAAAEAATSDKPAKPAKPTQK